MTATCEPPSGHRGHRWHWLRCDDEDPEPHEWWPKKRLWVDEAYWTTPERKFAQGWRYVGPAIPPAEGEGG